MKRATPHRCLLIEGIPGTGKTTTAETAAAWLEAQAIPARWHLEVNHAHPVMPRTLIRQWREPDFGRRCAASFARFAAAIPPGEVEILEATTFQSTARFLWAAERDAEIPGYLEDVARALEPATPALLQLRPRDPAAYLRDFVLPRRGTDWVEKLVAYLETTPRARRRGWKGRDGLVEFWVAYDAASAAWAEALPFPRGEAAPDAGDEPASGSDEWPALDAAVREWLERISAPTEPARGGRP